MIYENEKADEMLLDILQTIKRDDDEHELIEIDEVLFCNVQFLLILEHDDDDIIVNTHDDAIDDDEVEVLFHTENDVEFLDDEHDTTLEITAVLVIDIVVTHIIYDFDLIDDEVDDEVR